MRPNGGKLRIALLSVFCFSAAWVQTAMDVRVWILENGVWQLLLLGYLGKACNVE